MKHTVELIELANGAKGLFIDVPDASVVGFDFNFRAGDYLAPKNKWDTAHIMEHLVLGANARYKKSRDYSREFSKNGAYNNASTGTYHMSYVAECAEFEAERVLDLLCLAIEAPLFLEEEFTAELANVREELKSRRNNHAHELSLVMGKALGMIDLPYSEREKELNNITLADIQAHYKNTHTAPNLRFFIAGAIGNRKQAIINRLEAMTLPTAGKRIDLPKEQLVTVPETIIMPDTAVENVYYRWETIIDHVLSDSEDYNMAALQGTLLGTMHSRIFGVARERGLVYGINYGTYRTRDNHVWWVGGQVLPDNIEPLFALITKELQAVANGKFTEDEMLEAQAYAIGNFQRGNQTVGAIADNYQEEFIYDEKIENLNTVIERIKAVTAKDVIAAAKLSLEKDSRWALGFYGATDQIDAEKLRYIISGTYQ